ncbi:hypothetical protein [Costertonia aggregata]|uniref:Uncharacterized protein n=1 Tax=Costertonia aggregata TaxID=343403 RepID=A0A7H9ARJ3_9FLAO|nr:hypothetical protein [Costertonia aggregata]QLG46002.1 hypothetical protein HYG79_11815 [Costertonia aggregata]
MKEQTPANITFGLLAKLPKSELQLLVKEYIAYSGKVKYVYYFIFGFFAIVMTYNLVFAGRSFPIHDYKNIQNTMVGVVGIFLLIFLGVAGYVLAKLIRLKKRINSIAEKCRLNKKALRSEFHLFVKTTIGGTGIK